MKYFLLITSLLLSISVFAEDTNTNDGINPSNQLVSQQETELSLEDTNLLAKCVTYYNHNNGVLTPGNAFFYIIKEENKLFAIPGIVYKKDNLFVREQTLRASLPLHKVEEIEGNSSKGNVTHQQGRTHFAWFPKHGPNYEITFPSIEYLKERYFSDILSLSEEEKRRNKEKNSFETSILGKFTYTDNVYWTCNVWFD